MCVCVYASVCPPATLLPSEGESRHKWNPYLWAHSRYPTHWHTYTSTTPTVKTLKLSYSICTNIDGCRHLHRDIYITLFPQGSRTQLVQEDVSFFLLQAHKNQLSVCVCGRMHSCVCVCVGVWQNIISALACAPTRKVVSPSFTYSGYQANNVMWNTWAHFNTEDSMTRELMTH